MRTRRVGFVANHRSCPLLQILGIDDIRDGTALLQVMHAFNPVAVRGTAIYENPTMDWEMERNYQARSRSAHCVGSPVWPAQATASPHAPRRRCCSADSSGRRRRRPSG